MKVSNVPVNLLTSLESKRALIQDIKALAGRQEKCPNKR